MVALDTGQVRVKLIKQRRLFFCMSESEKYKYQMVSIGMVNKQINLRLPENLLNSALRYSRKHGFASIQDFIKETIREKLNPEISKGEILLVKKLIEVSEKNNLYGTEKELFAALNKK